MKLKLLAVVAVVGALAWAVPTAMADTGGGGAGALQAGVQSASTDQQAGAAAISKQDATKANTPTKIAGGKVAARTRSAKQEADFGAEGKGAKQDYKPQKKEQETKVGGGTCIQVERR